MGAFDAVTLAWAGSERVIPGNRALALASREPRRKPASRADRAKGCLVIATSFSRFRWQVVPAGFTALGRGAHENAPHPA